MKRMLWLGALLLSLAAHAEDGARIFAQASPSVVTVVVLDEAGTVEGTGSGIAVGAGRIVTACHVVEDATRIEVRGGTESGKAASLIGMDRPNDLCLLQAPGLTSVPAKLRAVDSSLVGEEIFALGNPLGLGLAISKGNVAGLRNDDGISRIIGTAPVSPGSSGGGIFDSSGRLIGITTAVFSLGQNISIAAPAQAVDKLQREGGVAPTPRKAAVAAEPDWPVEAAKLRRQGESKKLRELSQAWLAAYPTSAAAATALAVAHLGLNEFDAAQKLLTETLAEQPRYAEAHFTFAFMHWLRKQHSLAEERVRTAIKLAPANHRYWQLLAEIQRDSGRIAEARQSIAEAILLYPGEAIAWKIAGDLERGRDEIKAASHYETALRLQPDNAEVRQVLAANLSKRGQAAQAGNLLADSKTGSAVSAGDWTNIGVVAADNHNYAEAERAYRKALELAPRDKIARLNLAAVLGVMQRDAEAEELLRGVIRDYPNAVEAQTKLASMLALRGRKADAISLYEAALRNDPSDAVALQVLGHMYAEQHRWAQSVELLERLGKLNKATASDWVRLGEGYMRMRRLDEAKAAYGRAEKLAPDDEHTLLGLAFLQGNTGNLQGALEYSERVIKRNPASAQAWSSKGYALLQLQRTPEAVEALQTAVRLDPKWANALINLGNAQLQNRELGAAIQTLNRAIAIDPERIPHDARMLLARAYAASNQYALAKNHADILIKEIPTVASTWYTATAIGVGLGDQAYANACYKKLKELDPALAQRLKLTLDRIPTAKIKLPD
jgi:tetratricopeptide (TPR) repeat protein